MTPVMTIMGLEISSDVARRAQLGDLGWDTASLLNLPHLNTAFGYIAQLLVFLSVVLDVPLLYHVDLGGSFCSIQQMVPATPSSAALPRDILDVRPACCCRASCLLPQCVAFAAPQMMRCQLPWGLPPAAGVSSHCCLLSCAHCSHVYYYYEPVSVRP